MGGFLKSVRFRLGPAYESRLLTRAETKLKLRWHVDFTVAIQMVQAILCDTICLMHHVMVRLCHAMLQRDDVTSQGEASYESRLLTRAETKLKLRWHVDFTVAIQMVQAILCDTICLMHHVMVRLCHAMLQRDDVTSQGEGVAQSTHADAPCLPHFPAPIIAAEPCLTRYSPFPLGL